MAEDEQMNRDEDAVSAAEDTGPGPLSQLVDKEWRDLLEKDDRTSPAEYPDMALISRVEFSSVMCEGFLLGREQADRAIRSLRALQDGAALAMAALPDEGPIPDFLAAIHRETVRGQLASDDCVNQAATEPDGPALINEGPAQ